MAIDQAGDWWIQLIAKPDNHIFKPADCLVGLALNRLIEE